MVLIGAVTTIVGQLLWMERAILHIDAATQSLNLSEHARASDRISHDVLERCDGMDLNTFRSNKEQTSLQHGDRSIQ